VKQLEDKRWQRDNTMEAPLLKILIPIGPFRYGDTSHALSDGLDPPKIRVEMAACGTGPHRAGIRKRMHESTP
jgi:hypothetical protein